MNRKTVLQVPMGSHFFEVTFAGYVIYRITRYTYDEDLIGKEVRFEDLSSEAKEKVVQVISDYYS